MALLDIMPINQAIELYYEKHQALRQGNLEKLIHMKQECPEIFDKQSDAAIRHVIEYAKAFQKTDRYKELQKLAVKDQVSIKDSESSDS